MPSLCVTTGLIVSLKYNLKLESLVKIPNFLLLHCLFPPQMGSTWVKIAANNYLGVLLFPGSPYEENDTVPADLDDEDLSTTPISRPLALSRFLSRSKNSLLVSGILIKQ